MQAVSEPAARVRRGRPAWRRAALVLVVLAALALAAIGAAPPDARPLATRIAVVVLGLVAAALLLRRLAVATRSSREQFEEVLRHETSLPPVIPGLRAIDQTLRMSTASGFGAAFMLQPLLLELARWRLQRDRRIDLDATPELARRTLGEPIWRLIQARDSTAAWSEPGVRLAEIRAAIDDLERI